MVSTDQGEVPSPGFIQLIYKDDSFDVDEEMTEVRHPGLDNHQGINGGVCLESCCLIIEE